MWDGVHTIIFVVATFAAGRPNRRTSKMCVILISELVLLCRGGRLMCNVAVMEIKVLEWERVLTKMVPVYWGVAFVNPGKENGNETAPSL